MYYPYLFGRQYDLFSLDSVAGKIAKKGVVIPIIEPVVIKPRDISKTLKLLLSNSIPTILVLNPDQGTFKEASSKDKVTWRTEIAKHVSDKNFIPAFKITENTKLIDIKSFLDAFKGAVALIHWTELDLSALTALLLPEISRITNVFMAPHTSSAYRLGLPSHKKILARDGFTKADRNADYVQDEFFDDLILTYKSIELMDGFSDFTITGAAFKSGGGPAAAVAIHLTYEKQGGKAIWVRHFVSDDIKIPPNDVNLKIGQSLKKIDMHVAANPHLFSFSDAVKKFQTLYTTGATTSLAKLKQMSIEHHLELMDYLL